MFHVNAIWDDDANVFVATSDDIPGLVTEAGSLDSLERKLAVMVPEMIEENAVPHEGAQIDYVLRVERLHRVLIAA